MKVRIQKWGNSLALRIPKAFADESKVKQGTLVEVTTEKGKIIVKPVKAPEYTLDDLLSKVTKSNIHKETETGDASGKEVW